MSDFDTELSRIKRNRKLELSDWTQVIDAPLSESEKQEWRSYRQALRDLTAHKNWPKLNEEDWPTLNK